MRLAPWGKARSPVAGNEAGGAINGTSRLSHTGEGIDVLHEAAACATVPSDTIDIHGVGLRRVDGDIECDAL